MQQEKERAFQRMSRSQLFKELLQKWASQVVWQGEVEGRQDFRIEETDEADQLVIELPEGLRARALIRACELEGMKEEEGCALLLIAGGACRGRESLRISLAELEQERLEAAAAVFCRAAEAFVARN